jgi:cell division protein FtsZ
MLNRREFLLSLLGGGALLGAGYRPPEIPDEEQVSLRSEAPRSLGAPFRVVGIGGAGCNIVHDIARSKRQDVQVIAVNTDAMALELLTADEKVLIGRTLMNGRGSRGNPELGRQAALRDLETIAPLLKGAETIVVVAGLGGGTGSGAISPIVRLARTMGAFAPVVVTRPFSFEGERRAKAASQAIDKLEQHARAALVIPCDGVMEMTSEARRPISAALDAADKMVLHAVKVIQEASLGGHTGVGLEDMKALFSGDLGGVVMGLGSGDGPNRAKYAALTASFSPLLDRCFGIRGARAVYVHVEGGEDIKVQEVQDAVKMIAANVSPEALVRFGVSHDPALGTSIAVTVLATGFPGRRQAAAKELENVRYEEEPWSEKV